MYSEDASWYLFTIDGNTNQIPKSRRFDSRVPSSVAKLKIYLLSKRLDLGIWFVLPSIVNKYLSCLIIYCHPVWMTSIDLSRVFDSVDHPCPAWFWTSWSGMASHPAGWAATYSAVTSLSAMAPSASSVPQRPSGIHNRHNPIPNLRQRRILLPTTCRLLS